MSERPDNVQPINNLDAESRLTIVDTIAEIVRELQKEFPEVDMAEEVERADALVAEAAEMRDREVRAKSQNEEALDG